MKLLSKRPTIWALMLLVAVVACLIGWFRPITQSEAIRSADRHFRTIPGASRWEGSYQVSAWSSNSTNFGDHWVVDFKGSADGENLAQINVMRSGRVFAVGTNLPGLGAPRPRAAQ